MARAAARPAILALLLAAAAAGCSMPGGAASDAAAPVIPAEPVLTCIAVPAEICRQTVTDVRSNARDGAFPLAIRVTCSAPPCTLSDGQASVEIDWSTRRLQQYDFSWASVIPAS